MKSRSVRTFAVLASVAMIVGAFAAGPADAAKKKKKKKLTCATFTPGVEEAAEAEIVKITPAASEAKPVVIEYEHGPAGPSLIVHPGFTESKYFNIQLYGAPNKGLWIKQEFSDRHDLDLYLLNAAGEEVALSGGFNTVPEAHDSDGNATSNSENIPGYPGDQCGGYTIRSTAYMTPGTDVKLSIWFGEPTDSYSKP